MEYYHSDDQEVGGSMEEGDYSTEEESDDSDDDFTEQAYLKAYSAAGAWSDYAWIVLIDRDFYDRSDTNAIHIKFEYGIPIELAEMRDTWLFAVLPTMNNALSDSESESEYVWFGLKYREPKYGGADIAVFDKQPGT